MNNPSKTVQPVVYVVDDEEGVRTSLSWLLGSVGIEAQCFGSAAAFLQAYDPQRPACLVLDVRMPEMGGFELQELVKRYGDALPVIFVSGHGDIPMSVRAIKNGAIDFFEKPYNSQQMLERIQEALRLSAKCEGSLKRRQQLRDNLRLLTEREKEVLLKVVQGRPSKLIARDLGISAKTVDVFRANIRQKLGAMSLASMVSDVLMCCTYEELERWLQADGGLR